MLRPAPLVALVAALLGMLVVAPAAGAAKRKVPFGFFGTVFDRNVSNIPDATLDAQMARMAESGVESVRFPVRWMEVEPARGAYQFAVTDRVVAAAARHGLDVLPTVLQTPRWASSRPSAARFFLYAPTNPQLFGNFMRALVARYGPNGSFWATSGTPKVPIRSWQIWNEQAANFFWATRPWPRSYVRLLRAASRAVRRADRGATVVLGALAGVTNSTPWSQLRKLYRAGARRHFDAVSVHFFSAGKSARGALDFTRELTRLIRREMRRGRDRAKPIWLTELTWTAAKGKIPRRHYLGFETTPKGQAARLRTVFSSLARERRRRKIGRVYWYNWASEYVPEFVPGGVGSLTFQYSGLNRLSGTTFTPLPLLRTYARTAARFEGCRKSANARACR